ncbi:MAG: hypothetical protein AAF719_01190 [Pseudomonadota bacterium]
MTDIKEVIEELRRLFDRADLKLPTYLTTFTSGSGEHVGTIALLAHGNPVDEELTGIIDEEELAHEMSPRLEMISAAVNALPALLDHIAELETLCREYSKAMMHHAGGGSEMFKTVAGEPYADPDACSKRISESREHRQIINDKRIAELEAALKPFAELPANGGAGGPLVCVRAFYECELSNSAGKTRIPREAFNAARQALASTPAKDGGVRDEK